MVAFNLEDYSFPFDPTGLFAPGLETVGPDSSSAA